MSVLRADVLHGDCRELMRAMADESVDALVTDPPYGLGRTPPIVEILTAWLADLDVDTAGQRGFMGRSWDAFVPGPATWREAFRVLKPGAHGVIFAGDRTVDLMAIALRLAGFEVRHVGAWLSAQCFPKSADVSKHIDSLHGAEREIVAPDPQAARRNRNSAQFGGPAMNEYDPGYDGPMGRMAVTAPATPDAAKWSGWGTALKTMEPWILVRKPLGESTIARNVLRHGTGAINVGACRLPYAGEADLGVTERGNATRVDPHNASGTAAHRLVLDGGGRLGKDFDPSPDAAGRWPSALIAADLDVDGPVGGVRVIGEGISAAAYVRSVDGNDVLDFGRSKPAGTAMPGGDSIVDGILGPYTRHFRVPGTDGEHDEAIPPEVETLVICPKASTAEREAGLDGFEIVERGALTGRKEGSAGADHPRASITGKRRKCTHPTVKPIALMRHLVRLVTPPGGTVLDPFTGSGSTGVAAMWEGVNFIGCELTETERDPYVSIARARIAYAKRTKPPELRCRQPQTECDERQVEMFPADEAAE